MSEQNDDTPIESSNRPAQPSAPQSRLAPPTRAPERSQWAEDFVTHSPSADGPRRLFERTSVPPETSPINARATATEPLPVDDTAHTATAQNQKEPETATLPHEESIAGIGDQPSSPIHTLPPVKETVGGFPVSERTGEPRRSFLVVTICALFGLGSVTSLATYAWYWWTAINITDFASSAWLISWFDPRPGSGLSIFLVTVMAVIGIVMMTMPAMACYNIWHGADWSRRAGIFAAGSGLLSIFVLPWSWLGFLLCAIGCGLLWLPGAAAWMQAWEEINGSGPTEVAVVTDVPYGPLPRFR
ncbi:hypothetical protein HMPREF1531_00486 [Propionibacterium sp. oral taxon 192 str. F0372]|uniref:MFS transporter n=1 Tax=Propionibacterium sp. oral taxon 192 TaxID=671222 RepID=UPI000353C15C|nr:MFS transporter [Propionibacterium sp. oral taxon 192]EPH06586.1 hypothetical protein HMPREF1531_00486 [Propionibacterium sp. oral taxon 192 str. F0372]